MLVAQTAAVAGLNQHSVARNAFVFVLRTDNFWFVPWQYTSASEHIHSMFAACLLTVHTSEHHVLGCHVRLCRGIYPIVCTGLSTNTSCRMVIIIIKMSSMLDFNSENVLSKDVLYSMFEKYVILMCVLIWDSAKDEHLLVIQLLHIENVINV